MWRDRLRAHLGMWWGLLTLHWAETVTHIRGVCVVCSVCRVGGVASRLTYSGGC